MSDAYEDEDTSRCTRRRPGDGKYERDPVTQPDNTAPLIQRCKARKSKRKHQETSFDSTTLHSTNAANLIVAITNAKNLIVAITNATNLNVAITNA